MRGWLARVRNLRSDTRQSGARESRARESSARGAIAGPRAIAGPPAIARRAVALATLLALGVALVAGPGLAAAPPAGPPFPPPVTGQRVYDDAAIFSSETVARAEETIRRIEARTGAQVAVYSQVKPESDTESKAEADALALMNQWGVGRKGFDDGLVILFDLQPNLQHGQVNLYAGSGFRAAFLTNAERQAIFEKDMKPLLGRADFDGALTAALDRVDAAATPEHAASLEQARQINAAVGLGCVLLAALLLALALYRWFTHGRDPVYIDDDSVLMPAPPEGLTPAMATLLMADRTSAATASAALVDLAARGLLEFHEDRQLLRHKAGIGLTGAPANRLEAPEAALLGRIEAVADADGRLAPGDMVKLARPVADFRRQLERTAVERGWLTAQPTVVVGRWFALAVAEIVGAAALVAWTINSDASGGLLGGAALGLAGLLTFGIAWYMPARTRLGAMLRAMLAAYRRTLQKTMAMAGSMGEVVERKALPWVTTPDAAMAWGVAFGLNAEIDGVLRRTVDASRETGRVAGWYPAWWVSSGGRGWGGAGSGTAAAAGGLFSASAVPDVGSMMSALGSVGSASSGGGGFGGGGGGGGGGAGGGF